ncbi:MAG: 50S ribosomal protein L10 [Clostridia bacterium]|nr:50S ribosomal protein L10 [Clostridia bacterium]
MPSAKILEQKQQLVAELAESMKNAQSGVLVNYCGITVEKDTALRAELRKNNVTYKVIKNTYIRKAAEIAGLSGFEAALEGMTAIAVSDDPIAPAKVLSKFADDNESFEVKAGFIDGRAIDVNEINALAAIPSREGLIAKFLGSIQSPLYNFAYAIQAIVDKEGGAPAEAAAE